MEKSMNQNKEVTTVSKEDTSKRLKAYLSGYQAIVEKKDEKEGK